LAEKIKTSQRTTQKSAGTFYTREDNTLIQWFPTGEEFPPREEFHEFRGGISTLQLSYLFSVQ